MRSWVRGVTAAALMGAASMGFHSISVGQDSAETLVLSSEQVSRGRQVAGVQCSECHGVTLRGGLGPALRGDPFLANWGGRDAGSLYDYAHTRMPPAAPGSLTEEEYVDIIAFILSNNEFAAEEGAEELTRADLDTITLE